MLKKKKKLWFYIETGEMGIRMLEELFKLGKGSGRYR
jgi:hypothetical protein